MNVFAPSSEVYLSLPSLKAEPLASCSSDETSWAPSARVPSISLIERCCFILLCVPGHRLELHLQQPGPLRASSGLHIFHPQPIRKAPQPCSRAPLPRLEHMRLPQVCLFCSAPALTPDPSQGGIAAGVPGSGANERGEGALGPLL